MAPELPIRNKRGPARTIEEYWKMDHSTSREVICKKCQAQIDGRAIAISDTEYMCSDCWQSFFLLNKLFPKAAEI